MVRGLVQNLGGGRVQREEGIARREEIIQANVVLELCQLGLVS